MDHDAGTNDHRRHLRRGGEVPTTFLAVAVHSSESNDGGLSPPSKHSPATIGVIPDEVVRSLPLSSLWPHLSVSPWGSVILTAASDSLMALFVEPHHRAVISW